MPLAYDQTSHTVVLKVGQRPDRVWHFWSPSPRAALPAGEPEGCRVKARIRQGALLQMGMDYWRLPTHPLRPGWKQSRSRSQELVFPFGTVAGSGVHRYRRPTILKNHVRTAAPGTLRSVEVKFISTPANPAELRSAGQRARLSPGAECSPSVFARSLLE
jgi:hypothetical protein